jgi:hypothetical protein
MRSLKRIRLKTIYLAYLKTQVSRVCNKNCLSSKDLPALIRNKKRMWPGEKCL